MSKIRVLGIDLGTTALKAVLSDGHRVIGSASAPVATRRPKPLWSEQAPADWWSALQAACADLSARHKADWRHVAAIGLSGHMHGAVLLKNGKPLRPCILHNDGRAAGEAAALNDRLPGHAAIAGVRAMAGFTAPKLLWLRSHAPALLAEADILLCPKDYLRFRLTGRHATDPVDASGMWLLDVAKRQWCPDIVAATGLHMRQLPEIRDGNTLAGTLTPAAARALRLPSGVAVATGTGDAAANTLGLGLVNEGDGVISLGTAAQIFVSKTRHVPAPVQNIHAFAHALPGLWFQMAAMLNGASPLAWAAALFAPHERIPALLKQVEKGLAEPSRLLFLPYLTGERTPNDDPAMRAAFMGLDASTGKADMLRATLEGIALSLADAYDVLTRTGTVPHILYAVGGGFRSALWARMIASALGREISVIPASETGGALGVARLARQALTGESNESVYGKPRKSSVIAPDPVLQARFETALPRYRALYQALRPIR
ncbi:MAG: xylulokinase [Rhizobiales bacterium]|nr:xylulokinase [Hyphomicrobiales bacterium]